MSQLGGSTRIKTIIPLLLPLSTLSSKDDDDDGGDLNKYCTARLVYASTCTYLDY